MVTANSHVILFMPVKLLMLTGWLNSENINEIYNISTQTETSINELVETLETISGKSLI